MTINTIPHPLYAVIDLGSNSFHMMIARLVADSVQIVDKVKRKVRLASGLNEHNQLSAESIGRGIECLAFFAERLQDIPAANIRIVATAALRIATNADEFLTQAELILNHKINLLSGEQEAEQIYLGVAHTSCSAQQRLVLDIGGASTEIIVGEAFTAKKLVSLNLGCVTYKKQFFSNDQLDQKHFNNAVTAAKIVFSSVTSDYINIGWQTVLGGSGTMQALAEILHAQHKPAIITLPFLQNIVREILTYNSLKNLQIKGLTSDRKPVFPPGIAILIAFFECFNIKQLQLSAGAIREGLLYEMLPNMRALSIRQRTINGLIERFHIDQKHSQRILTQANALFSKLARAWGLKRDNHYQLLIASCSLHEIGLLLAYKFHQRHAAYILQNADLPGFEQADRALLVVLVQLYKGDIDRQLIQQQTAASYEKACYLLVILRLATLLCRRRCDDLLPSYHCQVNNNELQLSLPTLWLKQHPLIADELAQENEYLQAIGFGVVIKSN